MFGQSVPAQTSAHTPAHFAYKRGRRRNVYQRPALLVLANLWIGEHARPYRSTGVLNRVARTISPAPPPQIGWQQLRGSAEAAVLAPPRCAGRTTQPSSGSSRNAKICPPRERTTHWQADLPMYQTIATVTATRMGVRRVTWSRAVMRSSRTRCLRRYRLRGGRSRGRRCSEWRGRVRGRGMRHR